MVPRRPEYNGELAQGGERGHGIGGGLLRGQEVIEIRVKVEG